MTNQIYVENTHAYVTAAAGSEQDHNNNRNNDKYISSASSKDNDTDSVSDLEIFFNRKQYRQAVTLTRNIQNKWPASDLLLKRSMSLCSVRSYAHKTINGNDREQHTVKHISTNASSHCSIDQLASTKSIGHVEQQALHNDIRRCSFRSRNGTNNFVVNPLFDEYGTEF